ncbi:MAG TPA: hypothetical protein VKA49_11165 [Flavitalea sp.]|nr:hypothetical protein [Flavitalea sp.]
MFKQTFTRLIVLGTLLFTFCFALVSAEKARESALANCGEPETKAEKTRPSSEFVLERLVSSVMFGIK